MLRTVRNKGVSRAFPGVPRLLVPALGASGRRAPWVLLLGLLLVASPDRGEANGWEHGTVPFVALAAALRSGSVELRAKAAESLGFRGEARGVPPLLDLLEGDEPSHHVRAVAYDALGRLGDARALPVLRDCLQHESREEIRGACVAALGGLGDAESLSLVTEAFRSDAHALVRSRAVDALGAFAEPESLRVLESVVEGEDTELRYRAIRALGRTGMRAAAPSLLARLPLAADEAERAAIVEALARVRDPSAVDALLRELEGGPAPALRARIALALAAIEAPSAYDALLEMLRDPLPAVQFYALRGLRELGRPEAAGDVSDFYRRTAESLADRSSDDLVTDARAVLAALGLQVEALRTLLALGPDAGADAFLDGVRAPEIPRDSQTALRIAEGFYERQRIALHGLGYCHSPEAGRLLAGTDGIGHPDPRLRAVAARSLAVHGGSKVAATLIPMLRDPVPEVRWTAANALGRVADSAAISPLVARLQDEYGEVRRQAALSLGYLGAGTACEALLELASGDPVVAVREAAAYAASLLDEPVGTERKSIEEPCPTSN